MPILSLAKFTFKMQLKRDTRIRRQSHAVIEMVIFKRLGDHQADDAVEVKPNRRYKIKAAGPPIRRLFIFMPRVNLFRRIFRI
jgi:hypothetical protein